MITNLSIQCGDIIYTPSCATILHVQNIFIFPNKNYILYKTHGA